MVENPPGDADGTVVNGVGPSQVVGNGDKIADAVPKEKILDNVDPADIYPVVERKIVFDQKPVPFFVFVNEGNHVCDVCNGIQAKKVESQVRVVAFIEIKERINTDSAQDGKQDAEIFFRAAPAGPDYFEYVNRCEGNREQVPGQKVSGKGTVDLTENGKDVFSQG